MPSPFPPLRILDLLGLICGICGPARTRLIALSKEGRTYRTRALPRPSQSHSIISILRARRIRTRAECEPVRLPSPRNPETKRNETKRKRFPPSSGSESGPPNSVIQRRIRILRPDSRHRIQQAYTHSAVRLRLAGPHGMYVCIRRFPTVNSSVAGRPAPFPSDQI